MALARNRLLKELKEASKSADPNIKLVVSNSNIFSWIAYIRGPQGTPYEGGIFKLSILCPHSYPIQPPAVYFLTKCFHPNINFATGELCMDVLKNNWSPAWTIEYLCNGVIFILSDPNADSPLNCDAGNLIRSGDVIGYRSMARMYTVECAHTVFPED
ncbi:ubiquitin-conjugating enzyme E2, putative [Theileria equi strain WA]|uniref:Ubiquitin-conjugating enzyme E2, putative n=1 Tax=Theileria equi strain WA TaxID=1537102 RepID=L0ATR3_THEEQ|nr:ubiquitin-conjugating enzyme E2, putative [Theileria equi strain WA]AFZ79037.1 ubiquitin-conjugating enzyme E2, putative [Theileria equi strain WA]|eukprot:XP_004828703.1 ubiquitin-conjugating enzyme E2, putative [Theileria equi strain WA]